MGPSAAPLSRFEGAQGSPRFDPTGDLFMAQAQRPAHLAGLNPWDLTPLQRALLVIDGTVTTFLSAWALEPITVHTLGQRPGVLPLASQPWISSVLETPPGTGVLERSVVLVGARDGRLFAFAESIICPERLPREWRDGLLTGGLSLGQLLRLPGGESRREGLWFGRERPAVLPPAVAALAPPDFLSRTYRVTAAGRPLMLITERFPWSLGGAGHPSGSELR